MKLNHIKTTIRKLLYRTIIVCANQIGEVDMSPVGKALDKVLDIEHTQSGMVIKIGKMRYVIKRHFAETGKTAEDCLENAIIAKAKSKTA